MAVENRFAHDRWEKRDGESVGTVSEIVTDPVSDWAADFSHLAPEWSADVYPILDDLRQRCPIARTERFGGGWLPTRYEDVAAIAHDTEHFSSRSVIMGNFRPPRDLAPIGGSPPITSDPPFHHDARKLLLPTFTKAAVGRREASTRALCHSLIDAFDGRDVVDAANDYAQHIPIRVIADLLGFPPEDGPQFRQFVKNRLEGINLPQQERVTRMSALFHYLLTQVNNHLENPRDDLTTFLINAELRGQKLQASHIVGTMMLLLIAGTASVSLLALALIWRPLVLECVDPGFLRSVSRSGGAAHIAFLALMVLNLVGGFLVLGTLLAVGIMMLPAFIARFWARDCWCSSLQRSFASSSWLSYLSWRSR